MAANPGDIRRRSRQAADRSHSAESRPACHHRVHHARSHAEKDDLIKPFLRTTIDGLDITGDPSVDRLTRGRAVQSNGSRPHAVAREDFRLHSAKREGRAAVRAQDHLARCCAGLIAGRSRTAIWKRRSAFISGAATATAVSTRESNRRCSSSWRAPSFCSALSPIRSDVARGRRVSAQRSRAGFAPVVLPLEQSAGRRTAESGERRANCTSTRCWSSRSSACWPIRRADALVDNFAEQWLFLRNLKNSSPDPQIFPDFDDNLRQAMRRGNQAVLPEHHARRPQRDGPADRRLHVRQ